MTGKDTRAYASGSLSERRQVRQNLLLDRASWLRLAWTGLAVGAPGRLLAPLACIQRLVAPLAVGALVLWLHVATSSLFFFAARQRKHRLHVTSSSDVVMRGSFAGRFIPHSVHA